MGQGNVVSEVKISELNGWLGRSYHVFSCLITSSNQVVDVLKDLKDSHHYELFSSMLVFLKSVKPTERVIKKLITLQHFKDQLVSSTMGLSYPSV